MPISQYFVHLDPGGLGAAVAVTKDLLSHIDLLLRLFDEVGKKSTEINLRAINLSICDLCRVC